jgi:hypothetical protein
MLRSACTGAPKAAIEWTCQQQGRTEQETIMHNTFKMFAAGAVAAISVAAAAPASAEVRVGVRVGAPVYAQPYAYAPAPVAYYGPPRVYTPGYYNSRYDWRARREAEWRHREWLRHEEWRREQWRREHFRRDRGWDGRR